MRPRVPPKPRTVEQLSNEANKNNRNGRDPVDVYCRVRPVDSADTCVSVVDPTTVRVSFMYS